jgi:MurNAc alpha-1-phosphate uridylyltransferase
MTDQPSCAVVFCAGFGTRMRHLVRDIPKPMVPYLGRPMVDHTVELIRGAGIEPIFANTHHHAERIEPHLDQLGVAWHREHPDILDTGGGLKALSSLLPNGPVLTINPDAAWAGPNPVTELLDAWRSDMACLMLLVPITKAPREGGGDFAIVDGKLRRRGDYVYTGAQIIRPELVTEIKETVFSLNRAWDRAIATMGVHALVYRGDWRDIGTPEGLAEFEAFATDVQA